MKNWKILNKRKTKNEKRKAEEILRILFENRGIKTKKDIEDFLNPKLEAVTIASVGIDKKQLKKAISRIGLAIKNKEKIVVYGDYDVDGISGTAILWETLNALGANAIPYIPHRIDEGYGLSVKGINNVILNLVQDPKHKSKEMLKQVQHDNNKGLIITVDNGIVANKAVDFAKKQDIDIIITDHHVPSNPSAGSGLPNALAIVHTAKLCGTGVAWLLSQEILNSKSQIPNKSKNANYNFQKENDHLALVALATVADLVPLKGANRTLLKFGLGALRKTKRIGLLELFKEAGIDQTGIGVYEIGHIIAPRLNAMGRLEYAMDSLRLICAANLGKAKGLAQLLGSTNKERQDITIQTVLHAIEQVKSQRSKVKSLLFIAHESYEQGVIGLVAGKLVEEFYKPAIVVSRGEKFSKASARSVSGFNMIEFIRSASKFLVDAGGHPMAAGFTVETAKLPLLQKALEGRAETLLSKNLLTRSLKIDCELSLPLIDINLYKALQKLSPFGMGNPEPTFVSKVAIEDMRPVGIESKHIKFYLGDKESNVKLGAIAFSMGDRINEFHIGDKISIVYTIEKDDWNGEERLQLKIKDFQ